ncbi:MAG: hypothetical protein QXT28_09280 [Thermofilaceae archaeon]
MSNGNRITPTTAGVGPAPAGGIAGTAPAAQSPGAAAGQGQGAVNLHLLVKKVRAAAARVVAAERKRPGTYPEEVAELAVSILLTPVPQLERELRELAEKGKLSILDLLFEV